MFSFTKNKKTTDLSPYLRRICDLTTPNMTMSPDLLRAENRYNRTIPTLVCRWAMRRPDVDNCMFGLTRDLADRGIGIVLPEPFRAEGEMLVGIWLEDMEEPWFFLGSPRHLAPIGAGYWMLGVELDELADLGRGSMYEALSARAKELLPAHFCVGA